MTGNVQFEQDEVFLLRTGLSDRMWTEVILNREFYLCVCCDDWTCSCMKEDIGYFTDGV